MEQGKERIVIRIGQRHLSFSMKSIAQEEQPITYEPYVMKSGMSVPANLREALRVTDLPHRVTGRAMVLMDTQVLLTPVEVFEQSSMNELFSHAFPHKVQELTMYNVLPDLNAVAVFSINKDLKTVLDDHFTDLRIMAALTPVWRHLHRRSFTGTRNKLYGYFHDQRLEIFSFQQNRFRFYNQFDTSRTHDALYFLLYVWNKLMFDARHDELHLAGDLFSADLLPAQMDKDLLVQELRRFLQNVYIINPSAEFNRSAATKVKGLPFDLITLFK
jgi:hypothetical protein